MAQSATITLWFSIGAIMNATTTTGIFRSFPRVVKGKLTIKRRRKMYIGGGALLLLIILFLILR